MIPLLLATVALAGDCPVVSHGPAGANWADRTEDVAELAPDQLAALGAYLFPGGLDEKTRAGVRTDGVIIVRDGAILYERYGRDWTGDKPHLLWSASKSFATTLVGTASPENLQRNVRWLDEPLDETLLSEVAAVLAPVHNMTWPSGRRENN